MIQQPALSPAIEMFGYGFVPRHPDECLGPNLSALRLAAERR